MDFIDEVRTRSARFARRLEHLATEEATKNSLVMPFIEMLGYNVFDPTEVIPEFTADFGNKRGEKVDYALVQHGQPVILIEAKKHGTTLKVEQESQLFRYFSATDARFGILTDGIVYRFYSDLDNIKEMDKKPFFEFNMLDFTDVQVEQLKQFHKDKFNLTETVEAARDLKYTNEVKRVLVEEMNAPCDDFVRFILNRIDYPGLRTKNRIEQLAPLIKQAFTQFVNDLLEARLKLVWNEQPSGPIVEEVHTKTETVAGEPLAWFLKTRGEVHAQARQDEDGFVVLAGSKIAKEELSTLLPVYSELRKTMLEDGRLVDDGPAYRLTQYHTFKTSSGAASFVTGFSNSGPRAWKDSNGIPLRGV
jgi:hypothetical protein